MKHLYRDYIKRALGFTIIIAVSLLIGNIIA